MKPVGAIVTILLVLATGAFLGYRAGHGAGLEEGRAEGGRLPDPFEESSSGGSRRSDEVDLREAFKGPEDDERPRVRPPEDDDRRDPAPEAESSPGAAEMTTFDSDGTELGRHPAAAILLASGETALLVTLRAISDAQSARIVTADGRTGRVLDVDLRSPGRGLAVVTCDLELRGTPVAEQALGQAPAWYVFPGDDAPRPARVEGEETLELQPSRILVGLRLDMRAPARGAVLLDRERRVAGLVTTASARGQDKAMALPLVLEDLETYERVELALADYHRLYFSGSVEALLREARKQLAARRFVAAVSAFRIVAQREPSLFETIVDEFRSAHVGRLRALPVETRAAARFEWLTAAVDDIPGDAGFLLDLADTAVRLGEWEYALSSYESAWRADPGVVTDLDAVLATTYLNWGGDHERRGRRDEGLGVYERGVRHVPGSAELWRAYGLLLITARDYAGAASALREAVALDPRLASELDSVIAHAERFAEGPGKVVIDYRPGSRSIVTRVAINGAVGEFIVDTGATSSFVPESVAAAAGLDTSNRVPRRIVRTAGGERTLPYSPVDEIRIGDLAIGGISVIVGDLPGMGQRGLLGMDFLGSFAFENDSSNGRLVIYEKR